MPCGANGPLGADVACAGGIPCAGAGAPPHIAVGVTIVGVGVVPTKILAGGLALTGAAVGAIITGVGVIPTGLIGVGTSSVSARAVAVASTSAVGVATTRRVIPLRVLRPLVVAERPLPVPLPQVDHCAGVETTGLSAQACIALLVLVGVATLAVALTRAGLVPALIGVATDVITFGTVGVVRGFVESVWLPKPRAVTPRSRKMVRCGTPIIASNKDILMQMSRKARSTFPPLLLLLRFHNAINVSIIIPSSLSFSSTICVAH